MSTGYPPKIGIVILNWNGGADTLHCLTSLRELSYPNFVVLLVDNGSTDDSLRAVREAAWNFPLQIIENHANLGFAEGNNVGIRAALEAKADFVMLLNNDTETAPDCLDELIAAAAAHPEAGVFGPRIFYMDRRDVVWFDRAVWNVDAQRFDFPGQDVREESLPSAPSDTEYVCGAAMLFRAEVAQKIGLLDGRFFLVYEESDWCFAARRAGHACLVVPAAKIWHKVGASFGSEESPLRAYFSTRNRLLWLEKNRPREELLRALAATDRSLKARLSLAAAQRGSWLKRLVWALRAYLHNRRRLNSDVQVRARRMAYRDFLKRRFGDCPDAVRRLSAEWSARRRAAGDA